MFRFFYGKTNLLSVYAAGYKTNSINVETAIEFFKEIEKHYKE